MLALIAYLLTVIAVAIFGLQSYKLFKKISAGQSDPSRFSNKGKRFKNTVVEVLTHTKMLNFTVSGIAHWFVMMGFFILFGTLVTAYGQLINPRFAIPVIGHFWVYEYITELIAWATGIGIVALIGIRQVTLRTSKRSRFAGSGNGKAYYVEATILLIVFCVIALRSIQWHWVG